jgi:hypothetical protein
LALNLKKLQSIARRRLDLKGQIMFKSVSKSSSKSLPLKTTANSPIVSHTISYSNSASLDSADVYHALCKAKLNELGFTTIENAALSAMRDCSKGEPKYIRDATFAETIVLETYAYVLLFKAFPETGQQRSATVLRFESSDALTSIRTQMGFWGTAALSYYREASLRAGVFFPGQIIEKAIARAASGGEMRKEYDMINLRLQDLPNLEETGEKISDEDSVKIIEVIVGLFSDKTGLSC